MRLNGWWRAAEVGHTTEVSRNQEREGATKLHLQVTTLFLLGRGRDSCDPTCLTWARVSEPSQVQIGISNDLTGQSQK